MDRIEHRILLQHVITGSGQLVCNGLDGNDTMSACAFALIPAMDRRVITDGIISCLAAAVARCCRRSMWRIEWLLAHRSGRSLTPALSPEGRGSPEGVARLGCRHSGAGRNPVAIVPGVREGV